jgi:Uma2 family endonuclease
MAVPKFDPNYQYEDYLLWSGDWELYDGIPVSMSPSPGREHQRTCRELVLKISRLLDEAGCQNCELFFEIDWQVSTQTVVRPDIVIVCEKETSPYIRSTPALVVEVLSSSTKERDLGYKRQLYQHLGVPYYLWADPESGQTQLLVHDDGSYREFHPSDLPIRLHEGCELLWS